MDTASGKARLAPAAFALTKARSTATFLADEPTGALDHKTAEELGNLLVELNREENVALVVVTNWPELARRMGTVYELQDKTLAKH